MAYSTRPEIQTLASLERALRDHGYRISQKARVLDVVRAASDNPAATATRGSSLGDYLLPRLLEDAGPLRPSHPWLRAGDWDYAFKSHFDFVVHTPLGERYATHPLFAVEFDGPSHNDAETRARDVRKNRLCLASGLPLVRIDETFLHERDRLNLIDWLASLWAAHRREMPSLVTERDAEIEAIDPDEFEGAGKWLLGNRPDLDVNLLFRLGHPYPPAHRLAESLARRFGFAWSDVGAHPDTPQWQVHKYAEPYPLLTGGLTETWRCEINVGGPDGTTAELIGMAHVRSGYPIDESGTVNDSWNELLKGRVPYLPAGPWIGAATMIGEALCLHNTLVEVEHWLLQRR